MKLAIPLRHEPRASLQMAALQPEMILLCVRWYLKYPLYRNLKEMMVERGLSLDHSTIYRWVQHYAPELEKRTLPLLKSTSDSWRVDETYIKPRPLLLFKKQESVG